MTSWVRAGEELLVYFKNALVLMRMDSVKQKEKSKISLSKNHLIWTNIYLSQVYH